MRLITFQTYNQIALRWARRSALGFALMLASCQREQPETKVLLQGKPLPPSIQHAQLLFQRRNGIYRLVPAEGLAHRLTAKGRYPRWMPDGKRFVFIRDNQVILFDLVRGTEHALATGQSIRSVAVNHASGDILFADKAGLHRLSSNGGTPHVLQTNAHIFELDAYANQLVTTERLPIRGFGVKHYSIVANDPGKRLANGCSASLCPAGKRVTVNADGHRNLQLLDLATGSIRQTIAAPDNIKLDNQYWSNDANWITAVSHEGNIFLHRVTDGLCWQLTSTGDADRPDLFVRKQ